MNQDSQASKASPKDDSSKDTVSKKHAKTEPEQTKPKSLKARLFVFSRDLVVLGVVFFAIMAWQSRDLLDDDGSVSIAEQNFVSLQGEVFNLQASDKKTVMYFFAPWCSICRFSIGNLDVLNPDEYQVVRVALDYRSTEEVQDFINSVGVDGTVLMGTKEHKDQFNINAYPTYYVLDEAFNVIANDMGYSSTLGIKLRTSF